MTKAEELRVSLYTPEQIYNLERKKCINFPEYCEGTSHHLVDLEELIDKGIERAKERGEIK